MERLPPDCRGTIEAVGGECTARELTQMFTGNGEGKITVPMPRKCHQEAPLEINRYSDGSLLNVRGENWRIGGVGCWWPGRKEEANEEEKGFMRWKTEDGGMKSWNGFNRSKGQLHENGSSSKHVKYVE